MVSCGKEGGGSCAGYMSLCIDPGISSCVEELFEALSVNPGVHVSLHSHIIPTSLEILSDVTVSMLPLGLVAVSATLGGCGLVGHVTFLL